MMIRTISEGPEFVVLGTQSLVGNCFLLTTIATAEWEECAPLSLVSTANKQ